MPTKIRRLLFLTMAFLCLFFLQNVSASEKPHLKIRYLGKGRFKITRSGHKVNVNLHEDIAGCKGGMYDRTTKMESKEATIFHVIDETKKDGKIYVVLLVDAVPNCNVQGMCGAGDSSLTLIWLKLNPLLKLEAKKAVVVGECFSNISLKDYDSMTNNVMKFVRMEKGVLTVDYEQSEYLEGKDTDKEWRLIYSKSAPEKGFVITPLN